MSIRTISTDELRRMNGQEALILQGCGGSLQEWVDGINDMLTEDGILLGGTRFHDCSTFEHDGITCLVFPFSDDVDLNVGKLAMWRLATHSNFVGTWLSDYVPNRLGGFIQESSEEKRQDASTQEPAQREKPDCQLIGQDGNIFNLMGIASRTLRQNGMVSEAQEMTSRITSQAGNYYEALGIIGEYVNITGPDEDLDEGPEQALE
ncbi:MAG: hypothetical protein IKP19_00385 [Oscillospiraceae bacterium]|nr:hypothetical protein [Oscillospiraceae bacterium]